MLFLVFDRHRVDREQVPLAQVLVSALQPQAMFYSPNPVPRPRKQVR